MRTRGVELRSRPRAAARASRWRWARRAAFRSTARPLPRDALPDAVQKQWRDRGPRSCVHARCARGAHRTIARQPDRRSPARSPDLRGRDLEPARRDGRGGERSYRQFERRRFQRGAGAGRVTEPSAAAPPGAQAGEDLLNARARTVGSEIQLRARHGCYRCCGKVSASSSGANWFRQGKPRSKREPRLVDRPRKKPTKFMCQWAHDQHAARRSVGRVSCLLRLRELSRLIARSVPRSGEGARPGAGPRTGRPGGRPRQTGRTVAPGTWVKVTRS